MESTFPKTSTEYLIQTTLNELIDKCGEKIYTPEFKQTEEYNTSENKLKTLGIIISKYCEWSGENIETVSLAAFEDSNLDATIEY